MGTFDIGRARRETRGCENRIHLNNAGASLMPAPVFDTLIDYLNEEQATGGYETATRREDQLQQFYGRFLDTKRSATKRKS